ncbi:hypothetical protein BABINDRAFT_97989 [Babjeviella inositovora NRRL Y-12698]|uniref:GOLD domain-containing protein n=1 Tax=Babjeviella inositovora NRRL Y-12698 TaxID=984486 RepID=A0A1E3QJD5_9ASCO|nr:uncharacterized protein BABINDRAFT_97989 [Babjeviella inositovora NRRL Y-12698]ODQ77728.1 hypothetical protein BABINDRAFT_97989 [Babjeviella inositovora NRRL Y-12698]
MQFTLLFLGLVAYVHCFYFYVDGGDKQCFNKFLEHGDVLVGRYDVTFLDTNTNTYGKLNSESGLVIDVEEIFDNDHRVVHQKGTASGEFTFTTIDSGEHRICLSPQSGGWLSKTKSKIDINFSIGETKDLDSKGTERAQSLAERITHLNGILHDIRREQNTIRERESIFRDSSENTNNRVVAWSIFQILVLAGTCFWQLQHLRSFFVKQKLV